MSNSNKKASEKVNSELGKILKKKLKGSETKEEISNMMKKIEEEHLDKILNSYVQEKVNKMIKKIK